MQPIEFTRVEDQNLSEAEAQLEMLRANAARTKEAKEFTVAVNKHIRLYGAAVHMLSDIREMNTGYQGYPAPRDGYAEFRAELNEIAKPYGFKLVLVGDKDKASLVRL